MQNHEIRDFSLLQITKPPRHVRKTTKTDFPAQYLCNLNCDKKPTTKRDISKTSGDVDTLRHEVIVSLTCGFSATKALEHTLSKGFAANLYFKITFFHIQYQDFFRTYSALFVCLQFRATDVTLWLWAE